MASFFDLKARKEAAQNGANAAKSVQPKENLGLQPWVEK